MAKQDDKTNVMRILDQKGISYVPHSYDPGDKPVTAVDAANKLGIPAYSMYKTLVTKGASGANYVFVIPGENELDLKAAARAVSEKSIVMIKQAELLPLTGYIHGGCSPIGMKKQFFTCFEEEIILLDTVTVSAGKIGHMIELDPNELIEAVSGITAPVCVVK